VLLAHTQVLIQLGDVKGQQVSLGGQMGVLQGQLDRANQLAAARAGDTKASALAWQPKARVGTAPAASQAQ
jgi:hypothetical protein